MNLLEKLNNIFNKENIRPIIAKVISVDSTNRTVDVIRIDNLTRYNSVRLSASGSNSSNVVIPAIDSFVIVAFFDQDNGFVISTSTPDRYAIKTTDTDGNLKSDLKQTLLDLSNAIQTFKDDILDAISLATWATPAGVSSPNPINQVQFDTLSQTFQDSLDTFNTNIDNLLE